ncbi:LysR family transcriptional regulator substrate-binding protein [Kocuria sp. LUK]|uniref:LysR family transcriptional regulator substrate-binding protein n=1 Tax=Kocuria sp. LUK TaxID=2897828 RepID=UPI001E4CFCAD|nr:LysR family transcriptional regulator substrate-binding protein [Kocuria sp. LUK]MCD1145843.1 LysR family transcriptional regulator substrate-binding protein [Kocuria sp. LUK]
MTAVPGPGRPADETPTGDTPPENAPAGEDGASGAPAPADLAVAFVPGVMPGKWFFRWRDRNPGRTLEELPLETEDWAAELASGRAHACFVRLPAHPRPGVDDLAALRREHRAVELYAEQQVVVLPREHELTLLDEVPVTELVGEVLLQDPASLPERQRLRPAGAADPPLPAVERVRDVIELVAAGLGLVVVPMSVARLHHRKDLEHRVVPDAATVTVALVWPQDLPDEREELVQDFVGVVRGRGRNSSRGARTDPARDSGAERGRAAASSARGRSGGAKDGRGAGRGTGRGPRPGGGRGRRSGQGRGSGRR